MPQISIIIPAYNAAATIGATIASVQQQTLTDWELIVVDDGSTDNTKGILNHLSEPRLQIIPTVNGGVAAARNLGVDRAQGQYIAFLDADDLWVEDKLAQQLLALNQNPRAIAAYSWTCFMDEQQDGYVYHSSPPYDYQGNVYPRLLQGDFIHSGSNTLILKTALERVGGFDPACNGCEDWDMWLRLSAQGEFAVVPQYQIMYRRALGSATTNVAKMYQQALYTVNKAYQNAPQELQHLRSHTEGNLHLYIASLYLQHGNSFAQTQRAAQHLKWSLQTYWPMVHEPFMQKLAIKLALRYLLPGQWGRRIFEQLRALIAMKDPRRVS
ncbi:MAG: glycosyltransferase family A protein [Cyanobacteria bacterium J06623_7]